jgi:hypothetical protein
MRRNRLALLALAAVSTPAMGQGQDGFGDPCPPAVDVEALADDNVLLGVELAWGYYWLSGSGHTRHGWDPEYRRIYQFDLEWRLVEAYPQESASPQFGGRDPEALEDENLLLVGAEDGELVTYVFDPATGRLDLGRTVVQTTDVPGVTRGLAYHPGRGTFFTKDFDQPIIEFDRGGSVIASWPLPSVIGYGAAFDPVSGTIWFNAHCEFFCEILYSRLLEWNPGAGALTGREITIGEPGYALPGARGWTSGGLDVVLNGDQVVFVTLQQGSPVDFVSLVLGDGTDGCPDVCYPDCDASGELDFFDFLCFQNAFAAGEPRADCDGSGRHDFFDFLCFQDEFAAGCM